ncbi:hypothetical protein E4U41_001040 [Claviceps citrina]|nr:hypothetical protein E4U41_001040 [Claviceps citrina]
MSSGQAHDSDEKQRINNLADQDCAKKGIVLLLQGRDAMSSWMELQICLLQHTNITLMPLSSCQQLRRTIEKLRSHCISGNNGCDQPDEQAIREGIVRSCVRGHPLACYKIAKLMSCVKGLPQLAAQVETQDGQERICNALGLEDGRRLIAYFEDGPKPLPNHVTNKAELGRKFDSNGRRIDPEPGIESLA